MLYAILSVISLILLYLVYDMIWCWLFLLKNSSKTPLLKPLPLRKYAYYCATLHIDYSLIALGRLVLHSIRKFLWRKGITKPNMNYASQIARVVLDTSLMLYLKHDSFDEQTKSAIFYFDEFYAPNDFAETGYVLIKDLEVKIDLANRKAISCKLGSKDINMILCLRLIIWVYAANVHVHVHYFGTKACDANHILPEIQIAAIYTLAINNAGIQGATPYMHTRLYENQKNLFNQVLSKPFPKHNTQSLRVLEPYSETCSFLIRARQITFDIVHKYIINIDPEAFFLQTVMHSMDHICFSKAVDPLNLIGITREDQEVCADPDMILALFGSDLAPILANTKLHASKVRWHQEMYRRLAQINVKLANYVDWCIAF